MENKKYLKDTLLKCLIVIIIFTLLLIIVNIMEYKSLQKDINYKLNAIITVLNDEYPSIKKDEIVEILSSDTIYDNILKEYGYDIEKDAYLSGVHKTNYIYGAIKLMLLIISFVSLCYVFIRSHLKSDREINKIIKCIDDINHKNYDLEIDDLSLDKLSILKQEIYKTTVMLKENADISLKDKINLKNALEDISHQLKTPLTSVNILLDNIIDNPDMDVKTRGDFIKKIKREITSITFLVESILKLSKFETNTISFIKEDIGVDKIINETVNNVSTLCDLKNIKIDVNNKCKNKIKGDSKWQIEALTNILKNAIEYSYNDNRVLIEAIDNNIYTQIKIRDFGKGMSNMDTLNIFKRFYKGHNSSPNSIGIGLSLAKAIIKKDNGIISVESNKNKGTTFIIKYFY